MNRSQQFTDAIYSGGSTDPQLPFRVAPLFTDEIQAVKIAVDAQTVELTRANPWANFGWKLTGSHSLRVSAVLKQGDQFPVDSEDGPWAIFRFVNSADASSQGNAMTCGREWDG